MEKQNPRAVKLTVSEMPGLIPAGSLIELEPASMEALRFGDVLYVECKERRILCRFLRHVKSNGESTMMLAMPGLPHAFALPATALAGKVKRVSHGAKVTEPNNETVLQRLLPRLSNYGTSGPLKRFFRGR